MLKKFKNWLVVPIPATALALFRIVFGLMMLYQTWYYYRVGLIPQGILAPKMHFHYEGFGWVNPMPAPILYAALGLMGVSAALVAAGVWMKWAARLLGVVIAYFFFLEKAYYNNHIYFFFITAWLLSLTQADESLTLKYGKSGINRIKWMGRWQLFIIQLQLAILYFYGGVAKLTEHWLIDYEPLKVLARTIPADHWLAFLFKHDLGVATMAWVGFLLDFFAPLIIWYAPVRRWAIWPLMAFHFFNSNLFHDIGVFPYVMLGSMVLFFEKIRLPWVTTRLDDAPQPIVKGKKSAPAILPPQSALLAKGLIAYFIFQVLFPLRGYFLPNPSDYTTIGNRFSWHMKVDTRSPVEFGLSVRDAVNGKEIPIDANRWVNTDQIKCMFHDPRAVYEFAQNIEKDLKRTGQATDVEVRARMQLRYNNAPPQFFIDPNVDLTNTDWSAFKKIEWVVPPAK